MVSGLVSRPWDVGCVWSYLPGLTEVFGPQAGTAGHSLWRSRPLTWPVSPHTGAHPHGLLLQDLKNSCSPGGEQAGTDACSWR